MDKHKLILPISILLGCIILGGFFYASQINKQRLVERQLEIKLQEDRQVEEAKQTEVVMKKQALENCLKNADDNYQANFESYCISEGRGANCQSIKRYNADRVEAIGKEEKEDCFKQYK